MKTLAVDIGASSGKIVKGWMEDGVLRTEVVHRFPNKLVEVEGHLCWDIDTLHQEVLAGIAKAPDAEKVSIDTWGVDFVLLDKDGNRLTPPVAYRDARTEKVNCPIPQSELYSRTGIQFQRFNTIYQLLAVKDEWPGALEKAEAMLLVPDYLSYLLTGEKRTEYTNASTTNLLKAGKAEWDYELIRKLGLPEKIFGKISMPGESLGKMKGRHQPEVVLAPSHDTASAVLASPLGPDSVFLSSGTWSLLGCVTPHPVTTPEALKANFTNEGADNGHIRLLKNIMGTWMLQNIRKESPEEEVSFQQIEEGAKKAKLIGTVDPGDGRFLAPASMTEEISKALAEQGLPAPSDIFETANVVYHSLAEAYGRAVKELGDFTGRKFRHLAIVGGGCKDAYLNSLSKEATGLEVTAGPDEGSAVGNLISALLHAGEIDRADIPEIIKKAFDIRKA